MVFLQRKGEGGELRCVAPHRASGRSRGLLTLGTAVGWRVPRRARGWRANQVCQETGGVSVTAAGWGAWVELWAMSYEGGTWDVQAGGGAGVCLGPSGAELVLWNLLVPCSPSFIKQP